MTPLWTTSTRTKQDLIKPFKRTKSVKRLTLSLQFKALAKQNIKRECCAQTNISKMFESTELRKVGI